MGGLAAVCAAQVAAAQAGTAQEVANPPEPAASAETISEIVVEQERIADLRAAVALARTVAGRAASRDPLPRFNAPLCMSLAIDDPERGRLIGQRIIANARAAGVRIAKPGCRPNALVLIRPDVKQWIIDYRASGRRFIGRLKRHQVDRVLRSRDPVYVFGDIEVISSNPRGRLDRTTYKNIRAAAVMVDAGASADFTPVQLADYITMRLLGPTREMEEIATGAPRTILALYRPAGRLQAEMSRFDRTWLATLYRLRANANAMEVVMTTARTLAQGGAAPDTPLDAPPEAPLEAP
ncbi:hypothetical protein [Erythrobacter sp. BLCC-B19]|uniref:hypothetical protein n=1 Tax=Erythrobacter sp. BLCC-B19 TaxID=3025315 RepID=UPI002362303D|nr:hypothetical protein [Erythrobacter sp. BLCC-B19]WDA41822.1 hypothetical protein PS060_03175 [Erythrobacter sp. BLCC-B19]